MRQELSPPPARQRLESWKEVAGYLGRAERTVKRWEGERGLPIRRFPGGGKSRIYALTAELDAWRLRAPDPVNDNPAESEPPRRPAPRVWLWSTAGLVALLALTVTVAFRNSTSAEAPRPDAPPASALRLYRSGMADWASRTPVGLNRAVVEFTRATSQDPDYVDAWVGLANTYNLIREYTLMPGSQAFPLATKAADRALTLDPRSAGAHAAAAFADFYGSWDASAAKYHFVRALELGPQSATSHHWFSTFLMEQGDDVAALREIDAAARFEPNSPAIEADRGAILYVSGRRSEGIAALKRVEASHPDFLSPHAYLAHFGLVDGRDRDYVDEARAAARLTDDAPRLAGVVKAERGLAQGGHAGLLRAVLDSRETALLDGVGSAFSVAEAQALLGNDIAATDSLQLAFERHDSEMTNIVADPAFARLRSSERFRELEDRMTGR